MDELIASANIPIIIQSMLEQMDVVEAHMIKVVWKWFGLGKVKPTY